MATGRAPLGCRRGSAGDTLRPVTTPPARLAWLLLPLLAPDLACGASDAGSRPACSARIVEPGSRAEAIAECDRLFRRTLEQVDGRRGDPKVYTFLADSVGHVVAGYRASREDARNSRAILELLARFEHLGTVPALVEALELPRPEPEVHASIAARAILELEEPTAAMRERLAHALRAAFERLPGDRPAEAGRPSDEALQRELLVALDFLGESAAADLAALYLRDRRNTSPAIVRRLAEQLASAATPAEIPALVRGLFLRPDCQLRPTQGLARDGLVRLGAPAIPPLMRVFRGEDAQALEWARLAIPAMPVVPNAQPSATTPESVARGAALLALTELEADEAFAELFRLAEQGTIPERIGALAQLSTMRGPGFDPARHRAALLETLAAATGEEHADARAHLVALVDSTFDGGMLPTLLERVRSRQENFAVRLAAARAYAQLADRTEAEALRSVVLAEPRASEAGFGEALAVILPTLAIAARCEADLLCWTARLRDPDPAVATKAIAMVGRYGNADRGTLVALAGVLDHTEATVTGSALRAINHLAVRGSPEVIARIEALMNRPESEATRAFNPPASAVARRLRSRAARINP